MRKGRQVPLDAGGWSVRLFDRVRHAYGMPDMPVIVADEIARQIDAMPDAPAHWSPPADSYGCVAPPFARWFIEATTVNAPGDHEGTPIPGGITQRGVVCYDVSDAHLRHQVIPEQMRQHPDGTHWVIAMWGYIYVSAFRMLNTFPGPMYLNLAADGQILDDTANITMWEPVAGEAVVFGPPEARSHTFVGHPPMPQFSLPNHLPFALKALSAMHQRCPVEQVTPSRAQRRRAEKHDQVQLHDYYMLKVRPTPTERLEDFQRIGTPEKVPRREHIVRGHFRYYTEERPLFGRVSGMVWVPEHERGERDAGRIRKDYEVGP